MAELNFNALIPQGPRGFYQGFEQGQDQKIVRETNQIKLDELKRDRDEMIQLQEKLKGLGQDPDVGKFLDTIAQTGNPEYVKMAIEGRQKIKDLDAYAKLGVIEPVGAAPAMPTGAPAPAAPASVVRLPQAPAPVNALGSGTFGMEPTAPVNAMAPAPVAPAAPVNALAAQPGAAQAARAQQRIDQLLMFARTNPRMANQAMAEAKLLQDQLELFSKRNPNESVEVQTMRALGIPLTPEGYQKYRDAQRQDRLLTKEEELQRIRIANASRAPAQPVAPTITQIVDPTNPNQMIAVDARRYQGGGAGSPGVIGVGGKEPGAALRTNKAEEGKTQLANDLDNLRSSFIELDRLRAIPSTERNVVSNLMSATAASGVGQALGRAGGSPEQVERDVINSARQRLVASIKNATGMSSKSLDSNMELQTMLRSISDPGQSVEAAMRIISDIEDAYVKGSGKLPKPGEKPAAVAPNIDALLNKYK